jgi:penicillin-binding protein 2
MNRLFFPRIAILLIIVVLVSRLYELQLADAATDRYLYTSSVNTTRYLTVAPIRGQVLAADGQTVLAETLPIYTVDIRPADLPEAGSLERTRMFAQLDQMLGFSSTLTLSPSLLLDSDATLRGDLSQGVGTAAFEAARRAAQPGAGQLVFEVAPDRTMTALRLSEVYSSSLTLQSSTDQRVRAANIPGYQTITVKSDIPRAVALALRENAPAMPGIVIGQSYQRRYPLSGAVPTLSHVLGYIGRVNDCELVRQNTARSWVAGLLDSVGHAVECGIIEKQINPYELGIPRYTENDRIGKSGVESSYEQVLRGELGIQAVVVDALGHPVRAPQTVHAARNGDSVVLTIDAGLQQQVEQILRNWIAEGERRRLNQPERFAYKRSYKPMTNGVAIVLEIKTGRILAMASWPSYDNNVWIDPRRSDELTRLLDPRPGEPTPLINRAVAGQYPPGSTLKQFDTVVALQNGVITPETKVRDPGRLVVRDQFVAKQTYTYPNSTVRDNGEITVSDALMVSSNVFFMSITGGNRELVVNLKPEEQTIPQGLGITRLAEGLGWFGFGEPTGVALAGEASGRVPTPGWKQRVQRAAWTTGDTYNVAIGQGNLEVTPLQLVTAAAAVAYSGDVYRPQIAERIVDADGKVVSEIQPEVMRHVQADPHFFQVSREGMRRSVTEGINIAARDDCSGLQIAGKTGTAEFGPEITIPRADGKGTTTTRQSHSWFVGFAPYDNPQIEVLVLSEGTGDLDNGSATITVPAVTQIMQAYFGVTPPDPLPRSCQKGLPPLPPRLPLGQNTQPTQIMDPRDAW